MGVYCYINISIYIEKKGKRNDNILCEINIYIYAYLYMYKYISIVKFGVEKSSSRHINPSPLEKGLRVRAIWDSLKITLH